MRSDRDNRTESEREIDEFLSQFEPPVDELSADVSYYLNTSDTTKMTAARTFYGNNNTVNSDVSSYSEEPSAPESAEEPLLNEESLPVEAVLEESVDTDELIQDDNEINNEDINSEENTGEFSESEKDPENDSVFVPEETPEETTTDEVNETPQTSDENEQSEDEVSSPAKDKKQKKSLAAALFLKPNPSFDPDEPVSSKNKRMKISFLKIFRDLVCIGLIGVLCCLIFAISCITSAPKIDPNDIYAAVDTSSMIYNDEGKQIDSVFYTQNRKVVKYQDMPEDLINSFIAIEDKTFWKHHGFNWTRMIGAVLSSFTGGGRISGTSTITQQLARNVYLSDIKSQRSIKRKIVEMYYASKIEHTLSKEQIIEAYLNSIYLGYGCYGVDSAARTYFSKSVKKLDLIECAALAALPQAPEDYALLKYAEDGAKVSKDSKVVQKEPDTIVTNDIARNRRDLTLSLMLEQGYITQSQYDKNVDKKLNSFIDPTISSGNGIYSYFHEYLVETIIEDLMEKYGMDYADAERTVYTKGLSIYSTVDTKAQKVVVKEFKDSDNFPTVSAIYNTDQDGNMLNNDGDIALYNYDHFFDENGNFILSDEDFKVKKDGSIIIYKGHNLNIYETEVNGEPDYSLEFKNYYRIIDGMVYSIQGGYINIPSTYKSLNSKGNLVISADFFNDPNYEGTVIKDGDNLILTDAIYSLASSTLQPQGAMVIVEVGTGQVKAMVGGRTFKGQKLLNRAINARQPGSSIKPLAVYGAALQKSFELAESGKKWKFTDFKIDKQGTKGWGDYVTVHSSIEDERCHIENKDWPENVTRSFSGKNNFRSAIQQSINTCAVKLQMQVGNEYSMNQLHKFGITTAVDDETKATNDMNPAALGLGAMCHGVEPLEMALAYASFPGKGKVNTPICYTKVLDRNGEVLLEGKSEKSEALDPGVAFIMTDVLQSVVRANGYGISSVATGGKTGTTNDRYDIWFDGFTPNYAAALWIGTDQNVEMSSMSYVAARLWGKIMDQIPKAAKGEYPSQPSNVINRGGEYFTEGTETGLTSWSAAEERKKRIEAARKKWQAERSKHKIWVIDVPQHIETIFHDAVTHQEDDKNKPIYDTKEVDDESKPIYETREEKYTDENGEEKTREVKELVGYKKKKVADKSKVIGYEKKTVVDKEAWTEKKTVRESGHWEYEKGWRDGDFKYKGD